MNLIRPRSIARPVRAEPDGRIGGVHTEHWDDHVDAKVIAPGRAFVKIHKDGLLFPGHGLLLPKTPEKIDVLRTAGGRLVPAIMGGAFSASGLFVDNWVDILDATQLAIDTSLTTHKWALYLDAKTPNYSTDITYNTTSESSGAGYTAGGQTIVSPTTTESPAGTLTYDMADQVWAAPTSTTAHGAELYADALTDNLICGMTFGADYTSTAGTFTIQFNSLGVFYFDLTP
jgi:hypothetical protein